MIDDNSYANIICPLLQVIDSINKCDVDIRRELFSSILVLFSFKYASNVIFSFKYVSNVISYIFPKELGCQSL